MAEAVATIQIFEAIPLGAKGTIRGEFFVVTTMKHPRFFATGYERIEELRGSEVVKTNIPMLNSPGLHCFQLIILDQPTDTYYYPVDEKFYFTPTNEV